MYDRVMILYILHVINVYIAHVSKRGYGTVHRFIASFLLCKTAWLYNLHVASFIPSLIYVL